MAVKLTETAIHAAAKRAAEAGKRVDLSDAALPGLRLRLTPSGRRSWVLACRDTLGRMRRFPLGEFPTLGVAGARDAARAMRVEVRKGADPVAEARRKRAIGRDAREGIGTLTALLNLYGRGPVSADGKPQASGPGHKLRSWAECRRRIDHVFAAFLDKPLAVMRAGDLQLAADTHRAQQSAAAAVRYLRPVLKWGSKRGYVGAEVADLHPPATVQRRARVLSRDELKALLPVLAKPGRPYAAALRFMLLTLARREEVAQARWCDVDVGAGTWTLSATKNGQPHIVPLSRQALSMLQTRQPDDAKPDGLLFPSERGNPLANWDREAKKIMMETGTAGWTRHDLRRTGATMLGEMGELPDIIEAALNHVAIRSQLAATYNRSRYRPQVAAALQRLADALDGIVDGAGEVLPMVRT